MAPNTPRTSRLDAPAAPINLSEGSNPLVLTPDLGRVLLRIMRKAAERRGIDLDAADSAEVARLASPAS